ncbi:MAG: metallopeptidase family protein [Chloroflexota bacterium]
MLPAAEFEALIADALDDPPPFQEAMSNVVVLSAEWPSARDQQAARLGRGSMLLGLYSGIPLTERTQGYNLVPPDTITLYQGPLERVARQRLRQGESYTERLQAEVRHTVIHEIAHHFGISDERLVELGAY